MENNTQLISDLTALDRKEGEMWFSLLVMICFFTFVAVNALIEEAIIA